MANLIPLQEVVYDERARNGVWCKMPYPDHSKGCPNFPDCPKRYPDFKTLNGYSWIAVIEEFDLATHAEKMKKKHPNWTEKQCRNLLYWQNSVRSRLREKAYKQANRLMGDIVLEIPEACGVNVFETMSKHGISIQRTYPTYIIKTMLIGRPLTVFNEGREEAVK